MKGLLLSALALLAAHLRPALGYARNWAALEVLWKVHPPRVGASLVRFNGVFLLAGGWDPEANTALHDLWLSSDLLSWKKAGVAEWSLRSEHSMVVNDGWLWCVGGRNQKGDALDDTWKSADGVFWQEVKPTDVTTYGARTRAAAFALSPEPKKRPLVVQGGVSDAVLKGTSSIGLMQTPPNWARPTAAEGALFRYDAAVVSVRDYKPKKAAWEKTAPPTLSPDASYADGEFLDWTASVLIIGGQGSPENASFLDEAKGTYPIVLYNDVIKTKDGRTYETVLKNAPWSPRSRSAVASYRDRVFLVGGWDGTNTLNDVWSTRTGELWDLETPDDGGVNFSARSGHFAVFLGCKLYVLFGDSRNFEFRKQKNTQAEDGSLVVYPRGTDLVPAMLEDVWVNDHCTPSSLNAPHLVINAASAASPLSLALPTLALAVAWAAR